MSVLSDIRGHAQKLRSFIPASLRYGALYRRTLTALEKSQSFDEDRLRDLQRGELRRLLRHAFEQVPYYREAMQAAGLRPEEVRGPQDLLALPLLTKEIITTRMPELVAGNFGPARCLRRTTGGTSGTPLGFVVERGRTDPLERAFIARAWGWLGVRFEDRSVILKGQVVAPKDLRAGRFWQTCYPERDWTFFSSHHLTAENLPAYARKIQELQPVFIQSFPAGLDVLARHWIQEGLPPLAGLRLVHVASETLRTDQRERFERAFGARVFSNYGQSECAVLASECEHDHAYHVFPEYGVTEILRVDGTPTAPGEIGEIVGTGFNNYALPMIRYRTGDLAAWSRRRCVCGRAFPLLERLEGRGQDVVVARDGHIMPLNALIFGTHLEEYARLKEMQVRQERPGEITLAVVPYPDYSGDTARGIRSKLEAVADGGLTVRVEVVPDIPRTKSGKFKLLVQKLPATWWGGYAPVERED
ncbi:MAG: phenylacetate--CoA ligase family protein [Candidatus Eisenbacteria bacterium]|nr:phenylacetate--CoA ligase family protein [Candidatus Eisenbacteria bacterium]